MYLMVIQTMFHFFKHNFMITMNIIPFECVPADVTAEDAILDSCKNAVVIKVPFANTVII